MMPYTVEITANSQSLSDEMGHMRTWLDHKRYVPLTFRSTHSDSCAMLRVEFQRAGEAADFAKAFGGRSLNTPAEEQSAGEQSSVFALSPTG